MKKKLLVSVFSLVLLCLMLVACGQKGGTTTGDKTGDAQQTEGADKSKEMVTLSLYIPTLANYSEEAIAEVEEAMNVHLAENYGIQVKLDYTEIGNFENTINLAMTTDEVDVTCYFTGEGQLPLFVQNNQLLDITDYFEGASDELKNTFTEEEIKSSSINDRMYGFVRKYQYGGGVVVVMNKDIAEDMNIDPATITDMDSLEQVLYQVKEEHPELNYVMVPQSSTEMTWAYPWDRHIGNTSFAYAEDWNSTELKSLFELDAFAEFTSYTNKWYEDGLIMSDVISNTMEGSDLVSAGTAFCTFHNADISPLDAIYSNTVVTDFIIEPHAIATDIGNLQYGISANSANPDESFTLLSALYTDSKLQTILAYGIEGKHYVINDDGKADYPEGMDSTTQPYGGFAATAVYPNYLLLPTKAFEPVDDYKTAVDEWNNKMKVTKTFGFVFDTSKHIDFVTAYVNLEEKYKDALIAGSIKLDDVLPTIQAELNSIGFYDVLKEMQGELDAFLAE